MGSASQLLDASAAGSAGALQIVIGADGQNQGEGAIEGSYRDYQVRYVSSHGPDAHKYSVLSVRVRRGCSQCAL